MTIPTPAPSDKFSFGLWTVAYGGRDPFGDATRAEMDPVYALENLARIGAYGVQTNETSATATTAAPSLSRAAAAPPRRAMTSTSRLRRLLLYRGGGRMEWGRCDAVCGIVGC